MRDRPGHGEVEKKRSLFEVGPAVVLSVSILVARRCLAAGGKFVDGGDRVVKGQTEGGQRGDVVAGGAGGPLP
jgi:hypothetical protein